MIFSEKARGYAFRDHAPETKMAKLFIKCAAIALISANFGV
jgi:hypothetical protein